MSENPYKKRSQRYDLFEILSDLEWHCANCELPGSQPAASIRDLRRMGYDILSAAQKGGNEPAKFCRKCKKKRTHYRLTNIKPIHSPIERSNIPKWLAKRILNLYDNHEAITNRKRHPKDLTIDHRIPNIRWKKSEHNFSKSISDKEIRKTFQLLTNEDNLWKSRMCEKCKETGIRQPFLDINYFYFGGQKYDESTGCEGCGWYNPIEWKRKLNNDLKKR